MTVKLYERKKDAKFVATRCRKPRKAVEIQKIRIIDEQVARELGMNICPDLSIASRSPKRGEVGWIVICGDPEFTRKKYRSALEFLRG